MSRAFVGIVRTNPGRFLTSVRGDIPACVDKLEKAIVWRRQHQIDDFDEWVRKMKFDVSGDGPDFATDKLQSDMGKTFLCHFAPDGRPLLYMLCNRDQLPMSKRHPWLVVRTACVKTCGAALTISCSALSVPQNLWPTARRGSFDSPALLTF